MTAISITTVHPEVVKERLRVIYHLVTTEPEKYLKNRWELNREAVRGIYGSDTCRVRRNDGRGGPRGRGQA
ncbi:hypothetical protein [Aeromonas dhakensis]|uniref:hypothetical protein n=1 Tax=Aeromonas TaxID=642 RepID=UPI00342A6336